MKCTCSLPPYRTQGTIPSSRTFCASDLPRFALRYPIISTVFMDLLIVNCYSLIVEVLFVCSLLAIGYWLLVIGYSLEPGPWNLSVLHPYKQRANRFMIMYLPDRLREQFRHRQHLDLWNALLERDGVCYHQLFQF